MYFILLKNCFNRKMGKSYLSDIAYTLDPLNKIFEINRIRKR